MSGTTDIQEAARGVAETHEPLASEDRRAGKLARALFRLLADRPEADLQHVYRALASQQTRGDDVRTTLALASLTACFDDLGRPPSRRDYDDWRKQRVRPKEYASASLIRKVFTSWPRALDAIGVSPAPDPAARRLLRNGREFRPAALERALQLFAADVPAGKRTVTRYVAWVTEYLERPDAEDIPSSPQTFTRPFRRDDPESAFASKWPEALMRAGLEDERRFRHVPNPRRGAPSDYTPESMVSSLQQCAADLGLSRLTTVQYTGWARQAAGDPSSHNWRPVPCVLAVSREFGGWGLALHAAGLISDEQLAAYQGLVDHITTDRALTFLAAAMRDLGEAFNRNKYRTWRRRVTRHPDLADIRVPSDVLLAGRCDGDWDEACRRASESSPAAEVPPHIHLHTARLPRPTRTTDQEPS